MKNQGVRFGFILGGVLVFLMMVKYFIDAKLLFSFSFWNVLGFLVGIVAMYLAAKQTRDDQGGYISYGNAFVPAFLTFLIGTSIYTIVFFVLYSTDQNLAEVGKQAVLEQSQGMMEKMVELFDLPEDQAIEAVEQTEIQLETTAPFSSLAALMQLFMNAIGATLRALIIAAIVQKKAPLG